jgi:hypothetical protein
MRQRVFSPEDLLPGKAIWDTFELDPDIPLELQLEEFSQDLMLVEFENGCALDVGWYPQCSGSFCVALNQDEDAWNPFAEWSCRSIPELRRIVREAIQIAAARPSIPQYVFRQGQDLAGEFISNNLKIDPLRPLSQQAATLTGRLFELWTDRLILSVEWQPPSDPRGEFVVILQEDSRDWVQRIWDKEAGKQITPTLLLERHCRTLPELIATVKNALSEAGVKHVY